MICFMPRVFPTIQKRFSNGRAVVKIFIWGILLDITNTILAMDQDKQYYLV